MAERVALDAGRRIGYQDLPADALAERVVERRLVHGHGRREQRRIDPLARPRTRRAGTPGSARPARRPVPAARRGGSRAARSGRRRRRRPAAPRRRRRCRPTGRGSIRRGRRRGRGRRSRASCVGGIRARPNGRELDPLDPAGPLELGQERQERVAPVELVGAVGEDEHDRHVAEVADEEAEQVARRPVGPVEVLDDERDAAPSAASRSRTPRSSSNSRPCADPMLRPDGSPSRRRPGRGRARDGRARTGRGRRSPRLVGADPPDEAAEGLDDRGVGQRAVTERDAAAHQDDTLRSARARSTNEPTSRVLPTPASPATRVALLRPPRARPKAARSRARSAPRPIRTGLETRDAMGSIIRSATPQHNGRAWSRTTVI